MRRTAEELLAVRDDYVASNSRPMRWHMLNVIELVHTLALTDGMTQREIAEQFGVTERTVQRWLALLRESTSELTAIPMWPHATFGAPPPMRYRIETFRPSRRSA